MIQNPVSNPSVRVLSIEDSASCAFAIATALRSSQTTEFELVTVELLQEGLQLLHDTSFDVALLDLTLPDASGLRVVESVRETRPHLPIIVLSGTHDHRVVLDSIRAGAQDYLVKGGYTDVRLEHAILQAIAQQELRRELDRERDHDLARKDEFLSHISHELRTPLAAACQFLEILDEGLAGKMTAVQGDYVGTALRNAKQMRVLIDGLIDVARSRDGRLTVKPTETLADKIVDKAILALGAQAQAKQISLTSGVSPALQAVRADPLRLEQILRNLIENAIKFTPEGGRIRLEAELSELDENEVRFSVSDTGCGIRPGIAGRIFERLSQGEVPEEESRKGLGLGLYLCRRLVEQHAGRLWVETVVDKGSTFFFTLPCA